MIELDMLEYPSITIDELSEHNCPDVGEIIEKLLRDKKEWSALDILAQSDISAKNRIYVVLYPRFDLLPNLVLEKFKCNCADEALSLIPDPDPRSIIAIETKRKWIDEKFDYEKLRKAERDAYQAWKDIHTFPKTDIAMIAYLVTINTIAWVISDFTAKTAIVVGTNADFVYDNPYEKQVKKID